MFLGQEISVSRGKILAKSVEKSFKHRAKDLEYLWKFSRDIPENVAKDLLISVENRLKLVENVDNSLAKSVENAGKVFEKSAEMFCKISAKFAEAGSFFYECQDAAEEILEKNFQKPPKRF